MDAVLWRAEQRAGAVSGTDLFGAGDEEPAPGENEPAPGADLRPRERAPRRSRSKLPYLLVAVVVVAIAALLLRTLGDASLFFKNVDEAVAQRETLGSKRFRMQGTVVPGTIVDGEVDGRGAVLFTVSYNGSMADVASFDNPTDLFKDGIPVVLEGSWRTPASEVISLGCDGVETEAFIGGARDGWFFVSNRILVKHDASYESANHDRLGEAVEKGGAAGSGDRSVSCRGGGRK